MTLKSSFITVLLPVLSIASAAHAQIINTETSWNGSQGVSSFGNNGPATSGFPQFYNTPIFGQTFSAPVGFNLLSFFQVNISPRADFNTPVVNGLFNAKIATYDTTLNKIGTVVWSSGNTVLSAAPGYAAYNFSVNTLLAASQSYVFFAEDLSGAGSYMFGGVRADTYSGGSFVFSNTPGGSGTFVPFTTTVSDLAFKATFLNASVITPVPEPSTYALFGAAGCLTIAAFRRFRRSNVSQLQPRGV
ncbi:PEP-CTERM sorting domain-containing protein [Oleiharenicola lentus]|uniref:PEP-CTERM sorting domain-containing protein n=1 Tax=Oleiharenicola lentus TaxID=2508720 RepID=UPI003F675385